VKLLKIKVIVPVTTNYYDTIVKDDFEKIVRPDTKIDVSSLKRGAFRIESIYDEAFSIPFALEELKNAEEEGYDAAIVFCATDPGLVAAKELLTIPVVGLLESSMHLAAMLGDKFSILAPTDTVALCYREKARLYKVEDRLSSIRSVNIQVADLDRDIDELKKRLLDAGKACVQQDSADSIIFGCGGIRALSDWLQSQLEVPVIEPGLIAVRTAEMLVDLRLTHSKKTFMKPLAKKLHIYESYK
jgi:allantoin racemase